MFSWLQYRSVDVTCQVYYTGYINYLGFILAMTQKTIADIDFMGGNLALDFVNTVNSRVDLGSQDYLGTFDDLVTWNAKTGLISNITAKKLLTTARSKPRLANKTFSASVTLRECLYRIFHAVADGQVPARSDVSDLNDLLTLLRPHQQLQVSKQGVNWQWQIDSSRPESMLGPVTESAAELLTEGKLERIKECPGPDGCGWLFLDTSRNGSRHWCDMKTCGNVAKVRRFREARA
jgi:predicted RNA-binding Zn ribbon-like protein